MEDNITNSDCSNSEYKATTSFTRRPQEDDPQENIVEKERQLTLPFVLEAIKESFGQQEGLVTAALKLLWFSECMESSGSSQLNAQNDPRGNVLQNQVPLQEPHYVNMFGNNKMLSWGKLCKLILDEMKSLSACGHLNTILTVLRLQQPSPYHDTLVNVASAGVHSQQLGNILLESLTELIGSGEIDETLEGAVMEVLLSGKFDAVISNTLEPLENEVGLSIYKNNYASSS